MFATQRLEAHPEPRQSGHWGFMFDPVPKKMYKRMKAAKLSADAILVYMYILDRLDGKTKNGWTRGITDQEIAAELGISAYKARICRRELVNAGFIEQAPFRFYGNKVKGMWRFRLLQTQPHCKATMDKFAKDERRKRDAIHEELKPTPDDFFCADAERKNVGIPHTFSRRPNPARLGGQSVDAVKVAPPPKDRDEDIKNLLSPGPPQPEEIHDGQNERDGLGDLFYQDVLNRPLRSGRKRRQVNRFFEGIVDDIEADSRVENREQAESILRDAFRRVKKKVAPIWSHKVMGTGYGEQAVEDALQAAFSGQTVREPIPEQTDAVEAKCERSSVSDSPTNELSFQPTDNRQSEADSDNEPPSCDEHSAPPPEVRIRAVLCHVFVDDESRVADMARRKASDRLAGIDDAEIVRVWRQMKAENARIRLSRKATVDKGWQRIGQAA